MATSQEFRDYILDCLHLFGDVSTRKMMGEYCLYYRGKLIGELCDNRFLVKNLDTVHSLLGNCPMELPYEGAKQPMLVVENPEDRDTMGAILELLYTQLPAPKAKTAKKEGLAALPNIGAEVANQLNAVGITTEAELKALGAKESWLRIKAMDDSACIHRLQALEGAIRGIKKSELPAEIKADLKLFYQEHK